MTKDVIVIDRKHQRKIFIRSFSFVDESSHLEEKTKQEEDENENEIFLFYFPMKKKINSNEEKKRTFFSIRQIFLPMIWSLNRHEYCFDVYSNLLQHVNVVLREYVEVET